MAAAGKRHLAQLDGLRGPLCIGVIAINMNLYDVGANLPVGVFLIASGITAYLAYGDRKWDDASHFEFFKKRLVRLLPMVLVSSCFQVCASAVWLDHQASDFAGNLLSVALLLAGSGVCGCARGGCGAECVFRGCGGGCCCCGVPWTLVPLVLGCYLNGPGWYVGALLFLSVYALPKLLVRYGERWRAAPPAGWVLVAWALVEGVQFAPGLLLYGLGVVDKDGWAILTLVTYLALPPFFRMPTLVLGLQLGRWVKFEVVKDRSGEPRALTEARALVPALATALVVALLHGYLEREEKFEHYPASGGRPWRWALVHMLHPFTTLALIGGLVSAPTSLVSRALASRPAVELAELSYAMYMLHWGIITVYVRAVGKTWPGLYQNCDEDALFECKLSELDAFDYAAVVLLSVLLAYPVQRWLEPRVARWAKRRLDAGSSEAQADARRDARGPANDAPCDAPARDVEAPVDDGIVLLESALPGQSSTGASDSAQRAAAGDAS